MEGDQVLPEEEGTVSSGAHAVFEVSLRHSSGDVWEADGLVGAAGEREDRAQSPPGGIPLSKGIHCIPAVVQTFIFIFYLFIYF